MHATAVSTPLEPSEVAAVRQLVERAEAVDGFRPVSDQFWADITQGASNGLIHTSVPDRTGELVAYARAAPNTSGRSSWTVEAVIRPDHREERERLLSSVLSAVEDAVVEAGGIDLTWLVQAPTDSHRSVVAARRMIPSRTIYQMRRPLPANIAFDIATRAFDPDRDLDEWVAVNARAFAWNPEQGGWTRANVIARMTERWFDPEGFLIHERDGHIAGSCWTKIHDGATPALGEIYVISVDPQFHGLGLGRALTLAGLHSLAERGAGTGMLYVDGANTPARKLYDTLGFTVHRTDELYHKRLSL